VWVADLLPDSAAPATEEMMQRGIEAVRTAMEGARAGAA
jgi:hypothetical protein